MLNQFKIIFWDFDGVIVDSNEIRTQGFSEIFKSHSSKNIKKLIDYHEKNGGLSRYHKIKYFYENILIKSISQENIMIYAELYKKYVLSKLKNEKYLISDSVNYLKDNFENKSMHLISASDETELIELCDFFNISKFFKSIKGSPTTKIDNIDSIIKLENYSKQFITYIGDSINDYEASVANDINFIGYNFTDKFKAELNHIQSFSEL